MNTMTDRTATIEAAVAALAGRTQLDPTEWATACETAGLEAREVSAIRPYVRNSEYRKGDDPDGTLVARQLLDVAHLAWCDAAAEDRTDTAPEPAPVVGWDAPSERNGWDG